MGTLKNEKTEVLAINQDLFDPKYTAVLYGGEVNKIKLNYMMERPSIFELPVISAFKQTFGRQLKTWVGGSENRRFYIWTFRIDSSVLYAMVHNEKGVCWEYPINTNKSKLINIIRQVYKLLPRKEKI